MSGTILKTALSTIEIDSLMNLLLATSIGFLEAINYLLIDIKFGVLRICVEYLLSVKEMITNFFSVYLGFLFSTGGINGRLFNLKNWSNFAVVIENLWALTRNHQSIVKATDQITEYAQ